MVAWIALVVSSLALGWTIFWAVAERRRTDGQFRQAEEAVERRHRDATTAKITLKVSWSAPVYGPHLGDFGLGMTATNTGMLPVTLTSATVKIDGTDARLVIFEWVYQTPAGLPIKLAPGEQWSALADADGMRVRLEEEFGARDEWKLSPTVSDSAGNEYSEAFTLN